jgi:DNA polymerase-3 subunit alpha
VLGFYLSGHPLEENAGIIGLLANTDCSRVSALPNGTEVIVGGLVVGLSTNVVKNGRLAGQKMARFLLEDLTGSVPVTVFPRALEEVKERLADDKVLVCQATVEDRGEGVALVLRDVKDLVSALDGFQGALVVRVEPADRERLAELAALLRRHPGSNVLYLDVDGLDDRRRRVRVTSGGVAVGAGLVRAIEGLLGRERTSLARL